MVGILWRIMIILPLFCASILPVAAVPTVPNPEVPLVGATGEQVLAHPLTLASSGYRFNTMQLSTVIWANGRGDLTIDLDLTNLGIQDWQTIAWAFNWSSGDYSQIRAWDSSGPLRVGTERSGSAIIVRPQFRRPVPIGSRYVMSLAITIGGMASGYDLAWRASWTTRSGSAVNAYTERLTLPSNAIVGSFSPTNAERQGNRFLWRITNAAPGWSFSVNVTYTLSDQIPVPLFLQRDEPWGSEPYGSYPDNDPVNTVGRWGCYMTAAAMIARYHAEQQGILADINPKDLNDWLRQKKRYDLHSFNPVVLPDYAQSRGVVLSGGTRRTGGRTDDNDRILNEYLRSGNPVILNVPSADSPSGMHFVVAVGRVRQNNVDTYALLDPVYGRTTLADRYGNNYNSITLYAGSSSDNRALSFSGHSPIELLVIDPYGRRAGLDPRTGTYYDEIPNAIYETIAIAPAVADGAPSHEFRNLTIYEPADGSYVVEVIGTGVGPFTLVTIGADWRGQTTLRTETGTATEGSLARIPVGYGAVGGLFPSVVFLPTLRR